MSTPAMDSPAHAALYHVSQDSSPAQRLPVELLAEIFVLTRELCVTELFPSRSATDGRSQYKWLAITLVCRHWYSIATTQCAILWSEIRIPMISSRRFLRMTLNRSQGMPLFVTYRSPYHHTGELDSVRLLLAALAELHRVRELIIWVTPRAAILLADALRCPAPNLRVYKVQVTPEQATVQDIEEREPSAAVRAIDTRNMPHLHTFSLSGGACRTMSWQGLQNTASLRVFDISMTETAPDNSLDQLMECLGGMCALEILTVNLSSQQMSSYESLPTVHLSRLQRCRLRIYTSSADAFLTHLVLPETVDLDLDIHRDDDLEPDAILTLIGTHVANLAHELRTLWIYRSFDLVLAAWRSVLPPDATDMYADHRAFRVKLSVDHDEEVNLASLPTIIPLSSAQEVVVRVPLSSRTELHRAEWVSLAAGMPHVTHLRLLFDSPGLHFDPPVTVPDLRVLAEVSSRPGETTPIWPSLSVLGLEGLLSRSNATVEMVRAALVRRKIRGCARLAKLIVSESTLPGVWKDILDGIASEITGTGNTLIL